MSIHIDFSYEIFITLIGAPEMNLSIEHAIEQRQGGAAQ